MALLRESPSPAQLVGVSFIVGGIAIATLWGKGRDRAAVSPRRSPVAGS
jgi:drug/metabolite transporter (DMT)-like permease